MRIVAILLLSSLAFGCSIPDPLGPEKVDSSKLESDGIVIVSVGRPEKCTFGPFVNLKFSSDDSTAALIMVNNLFIGSDFADHYGRVNVLTLKPGKYKIFPAAQPPELIQNAADDVVTVEARQVQYIGEYFINAECMSVSSHYSRFRTDFIDRYDRDIAFLRAKNAAFAKTVIEKHIANLHQVIEDTR